VLFNMAVRIRDRAIRRCGELLKQLPAHRRVDPKKLCPRGQAFPEVKPQPLFCLCTLPLVTNAMLVLRFVFV
jgi:hypothetical protein